MATNLENGRKLEIIGNGNHNNNGNGIRCEDEICILDQPQIIPGDGIIVCHFSGCSRGKKQDKEVFVPNWKKIHNSED